MAEVMTRLPLSLDDVLAFSQGRHTNATVELVSREIIEKARPERGADEDVEAYLLKAHFRIMVEEEPHWVTNIYAEGYNHESAEIAAAHRKIANARLRRDYKRLQEAGIAIHPLYFQEVEA